MARIADLKLSDRVFMKTYRFRSFDWAPGARLRGPLRESKVALITTAGLHLPGQPAFDPKVRGGDTSFREIPADVDVQILGIAHRSSTFNQAGARADRNLVFPLDRVKELQARHEIGSLNRRHFSFMGGITAPGRLIAESAPAVAQKLGEDDVGACLLVPV